MSLAQKFADLLERAQESEEYWRDIAVTDFTRELHERMRSLGMTHAELARRMGTSRPYVTKLLDGGNFTLHTMVKLAMALDVVVRIHLEPKEERAATTATHPAEHRQARALSRRAAKKVRQA